MFKRQDPSKLQAQLSQLKGGSSFDKNDAKEWKLKTDTQGNGSAVIRFLPGMPGKGDVPFVKLINHGFRKNGQWYINNCTSTHGDYDSCPVCKYLQANDLYNTDKTEYQNLKRKMSYWANILVIKDPLAPENEGKVFKFRFGQKIMDKITAMINVNTDLGEVPQDVTCVFTGSNFLLKAKKVDKHQNYDDSKFMSASEIANINDPAVQAKLVEDMEDIGAIVAKDKFRSFEENDKQFKKVMGVAAMGATNVGGAAALESQLDSFDMEMNAFNGSTQGATQTGGMSASEADDLLAGLTNATPASGGADVGGDDFDLDSLLDM